ncbi:aminopeptidase 2 [Pseudozyma hubeiensis SY62]|uniref:Aminopeptidase 2 n=1 Tax=Pseudozyma hubeiensis (strain SY62) TaxID=1305764 RepID=R9P4X7_PSEHS|nr:aminopeptidase 2 [Pseudozyma hubeiensis SY62]GAC96344.1 aminopeptidase 2 [Pseudozyma hubeiensis SY62]
MALVERFRQLRQRSMKDLPEADDCSRPCGKINVLPRSLVLQTQADARLTVPSTSWFRLGRDHTPHRHAPHTQSRLATLHKTVRLKIDTTGLAQGYIYSVA